MLSRRDFLKLGGTALLAAAFPPTKLTGVTASTAPVVYRGTNAYRRIALTYDDCWHPEVLQQLSAMLQPYPDFHFTFFTVGDAIEIDEAVRPGIWKLLYQQGHEIGYHTFHHVDPQVMSAKSLIADFDQWMETLQGILGFEPKVHFARPPFDDLSLSFLDLCLERSLVATMYSTGFEAPNLTDSMLLVSQAMNGDIVQMHTYQDPANQRFDVDITSKAVPYLAEQGFTLVTMSQLYDDMLRTKNSSQGCSLGAGDSLTRTCLDP